MFDSVFSGYVRQEKEPFIQELEKKEQAIASLLVNNINQITKVLLDTPKEKLEEEIKKAQGKLRISLQNNFWATWLSGWQMGTRHGSDEIKGRANFAEEAESLGGRFPSPELSKTRPLRNTAAERAIRQRNNQLANDVTNSEFKRIRKHLLAATSPQPGTGEPIDRTELLRRINNEIGIKGSRYRRRAETIARTELTFAYNAGRLETYRESGLVEAVKFYTILDERRCDICASRQGIVIPLDNWQAIAANSPGLHPNCRCVWTPVLKDSPDLEDPTRKIENRSLVSRGALWMGAAILAAVLLGRGQGARQAVEEGVNLLDVATAQVISSANASRTQDERNIEEQPEQQSSIQTEAPSLGIKNKPQLMVGSLDLNTATREDLMRLLPGRQLSIRQIIEIIRARSKQPFTSIEDLRNIPGIGEKTYERIKQLAEGYKLIPLIDPVSIKTPAQLWASNLGLTKKQAQILFEELRRGSFKDIEDLKQRLKGQGFGDKTIENLKNRSAIVKREVTTAVRVTQSVGQESGFTPSSAPTSQPSLTPSRPPAPYRYAPTTNARTTNNKVFTDLNNEISQLQKATDDFLDASITASDAKLKTKANLFDKSLNSIISEGEQLSNNLQLNTQGVEESLDKVREWDRRLGSLEENYQKLFDPNQPNYFEEAPQIISQIRAQLKQTRNKLEGTRQFNERTISNLESKLDAAEQKLTKLKQQKDIAASQLQAETLRSQSRIIGDRILAMEREIAQIPPGATRSQAWLEISRLKAQKADLDTRIKSSGELLDESLEILRNKASDNSLNAVRSTTGVEDALSTLDVIAQRLEALPVKKNQLPNGQQAIYEQSVKVRGVQRQANKQLRQFRQSQGLATRNLNNAAQENIDLYNRYDEQFKNFEQSVSPVINRLYNEINDDLAFLNSLPQGSVPILLNSSKWQGGTVPPELALQFPGSSPTMLQQFSQEVANRYNRVKGKIKQIKGRSEFEYIDTNGQKYAFDDVLQQAENNLQQWQQIKDANLNPNNIGSSNNRLDTLWRQLQKARKVGDEQEVTRLLGQFTADDAFGYARRTLLSLGEWDKAYQDLIQATAKNGEVVPASVYQRFQDAQELLLQEIGQSRINTSQIIDTAYNDARDIYERIRSDRSSVPSFEVNNTVVGQQELLKQLEGIESQLKQVSTQKEVITTADKQLQKTFDDLLATANKTQENIDFLTAEIANSPGGTKRKQRQLEQLQQQLEQERSQLKEISDRIRQQNQTPEEIQQVEQQKRETASRRQAIARIGEIKKAINRINEQLPLVGGVRKRRLEQQLEELQQRLDREERSLN